MFLGALEHNEEIIDLVCDCMPFPRRGYCECVECSSLLYLLAILHTTDWYLIIMSTMGKCVQEVYLFYSRVCLSVYISICKGLISQVCVCVCVRVCLPCPSQSLFLPET